MTAANRRRDHGPVQFATLLDLDTWQFHRALHDGLIPPADPATGRWPAVVVEAALAEAAAIREAVGCYPDVGAVRAGQILTIRFGIEVYADAVIELARKGLVPVVGEYKDYPLYDGRALEAFDDLDALQKAITDGRLLTRVEVAQTLQVRVCDIDHLIGAHWLEPVTYVHSAWQRRRSAPVVALFRAGDLDVLAHHPAIDWDTVRATPPGRPSPLARLHTAPTATASRESR